MAQNPQPISPRIMEQTSPRCNVIATKRECVHQSPIDYFHPLFLMMGQLIYIIMEVILERSLKEEYVELTAMTSGFLITVIIILPISYFTYVGFKNKKTDTKTAFVNILIDVCLSLGGNVLGYAIPTLTINFIIFGILLGISIILVFAVYIRYWQRQPQRQPAV